MLEEACDRGIERVEGAPPQLVRFIRSMENVPSWIDVRLIERGARLERDLYANRAPFVLRGASIGTFMNKYSALPMALTGSFSSKTSARRTKETATFFTTSVMPGALGRYGAGFKAAAMVRLMHAMVRFNVLTGDRWDATTYGIPIPQVDQMPVGVYSVFPIALDLLRRGRTTFTPDERARVELARYRSFLLGLPEALLEDTPQGIVAMFLTRHATLRTGYDDTCSALIRATMEADLSASAALPDRVHTWLERGFSKSYVFKHFLKSDKRAAAQVGVEIGFGDRVSTIAAPALIAVLSGGYGVAARIPVVRDWADRSLVRRMVRQLARYGHAEFTTNADAYRPVML
jgi:hypothetical protein